MLGLGDDPASAVPGGRGVGEVLEEPLLQAGAAMFPAGRDPGAARQPLEHLVLGQADEVVHMVAVAPTQHLPAAKAAVSAEEDLDVGPLLAEAAYQQLEDRPAV